MKLFFSPNSRAVRVAWCLEEMGLSYDLHSIPLGDPEMRSPEYRKRHPMGRVPVLEDGDVTIFESGAIIQYLLAKYGNHGLVPAVDSVNFAQYLQWFHYAEGMIMPPMNTLVVETILLPPERRTEVNVKRATKLLGQMLAAVDQQLEGREFIAGPFSAADFMTGHATAMAVKLGADISDKPNIKPYVNRLLARVGFQRALAL
jgi:glutathione S-transferase